jgi:hypothetical protein
MIWGDFGRNISRGKFPRIVWRVGGFDEGGKVAITLRVMSG